MPALYRKYRSENFETVIGQPQVTEILKLALKNDKISHGYLFVGPHGVGKTSVARILAYAINKLPYSKEAKHIDVIEIDAASNTGVDHIRDLIEKAQIAPNLATKKIYIIDEVHMLSKSAFNAFLKLLEEPPKHVVFIMATTDEQKVPNTIISRTQRFVFKKIPEKVIIDHLKSIVKQEKIAISDKSLAAIAKFSKGSFRDAINILDQVSSISDDSNEKESLITQVLGIIDDQDLQELLTQFQAGDLSKINQKLDELYNQNFEAFEIAHQLANYIKNNHLENWQNISLLTDLITINRSENQDIKLLLALSKHFKTTPTKKNIEPKSSKAKPTPTKVATEKPVAKPKSAPKKEVIKPESTKKPKAKAKKKSPTKFEWDNFINTIKSDSMAVYSIVKDANFDFSDDILTLKVKNNFFKKRLETTKQKQVLTKTLKNLNFDDITVKIEIDPKVMKQKDSIKKVKEIMGGGEETKIDG